MGFFLSGRKAPCIFLASPAQAIGVGLRNLVLWVLWQGASQSGVGPECPLRFGYLMSVAAGRWMLSGFGVKNKNRVATNSFTCFLREGEPLKTMQMASP